MSTDINIANHKFSWINESEVKITDDKIAIFAPEKTDYFNDPVLRDGVFPKPIANAPLLYTELTGDFVFTVKTTPTFKTFADAGCIMIYENDYVWGKLCFEKSDMPGDKPAIVSVATNITSDDVNSLDLDVDSVYLRAARVDQTIALYYSLDGKTFVLVRLFSIPMGDTIKIGLVSQAPTGEAKWHEFSELEITPIRIENLRQGI